MNNIDNNLNENESVETVIQPEITSKKLAQVEYNVKNDEEGQAFLLFQKKFVYKKNWIKTIAFAVAAVLFMISIIRKPEQPMNYLFAAICIAFIFIIWTNTKKIRKSLLEALKLIEDDKYIFTMYEDCFKIETIIPDEVDENGEKIPPVQPRVVFFDDTVIDVIENDEMFVLILKKDTIYVLPKRCMDNEREATIRNKFKEKTAEKYTNI